MPKLVFLGKEFGGRSYELRVEQTTVGRAAENTLVIPHKSISHRHCEILSYGSEVIVRDLNSTNGTFVDDARVRPQAGVRSGQVIRFGDVEARLELEVLNERSSEVTAIYDHARALRDQRREKARGAVDPKEIFEPPGPTDDPDTKTLFMRAPVQPEPSTVIEPISPAEPDRKGQLTWWIIGVLAVGGLILLAIFLLK